jgi:PAS domain S-box-containing protein
MEQANGDPFPGPVVSIGNLVNREPGPWTNNRVHLSGTVVKYAPGQHLVIREPTGMIRARITQETEAKPEDRVELWGYLSVAPRETVLGDGYFEVVRAPERSVVSIAANVSAREATNRFAELRYVSDIVKLSKEAAQKRPVRLHGVITYADYEWRNGFLQDESGGLYFSLNQPGIRPGQWVELSGQTGPGGFAPEVNNSQIQVLGVTNLPAPVRVDLDEMASGSLDAHWVEMEGIVRRLNLEWGHLRLNLMTRRGRFNAVVPVTPNIVSPHQLIDARVRIQGACSSELNSRGQLIGITLNVPGLDDIRVLESAPKDPFAVAATPIEAVGKYDPTRLAHHRVKVSGVVTLSTPNQGFFVQDSTGGIWVNTAENKGIVAGAAIEAFGFTAMGSFCPYLDEATCRVTGTAPLPPPMKTSAESIISRGTNAGVLVQLEALLLQDVVNSTHPELVLQDGQIIFTARIEAPQSKKERVVWRAGSVLRLTGVCSIQSGEQHEPESFLMFLRGAEDIKVLKNPSRWTTRNALIVAGSLLVLSLSSLAWIALLRREVGKQTGLVRQKLRQEAALEERYRDLFENASDAIFTFDIEGELISLNQAAAQVFGGGKLEFLGATVFDLIAPQNQPFMRAMIRKLQAGESVSECDIEIVNRRQQRIALEISLRLLPHGGKHKDLESAEMSPSTLIFAMARDTTERKQVEEATRRSEERYRHLVESSNDLIWEVDQKTVYTFVSHHISDLLGYEAGEIVGKRPFDLMPEEEASRVAPLFAAHTDRRESFRGLEYVSRHKDGRLVSLETNGVPRLGDEGQLLGYRGTARDITERKRAEEHKANLEMQLRQAQKLEAIGTLAGGIAHDFNNILGIIIPYVDLAKMQADHNPEAQASLSEIGIAAQRAARAALKRTIEHGVGMD